MTSGGYLPNGITSIKLGLADYELNDDDRSLSAIRNLYAGLLLIFKEKLARLSPEGSDEVLVKSNIIPAIQDGRVFFKGQGKSTVDLGEIKQRFKSLGVTTHLDRLEKVSKHRNEVEHAVPSISRQTLRAVIADTFLIVRDFLRSELDEEPVDLLGDGAWGTMLSVHEVVEAERRRCAAAWAEVNWTSHALRTAVQALPCANCGLSLLLAVDVEAPQERAVVKCQSCGSESPLAQFADEALGEYFNNSRVHPRFELPARTRDGSPLNIDMCPSCSRFTYLYIEDGCVLCGFEQKPRVCQVCYRPLRLDERGFGGACTDCVEFSRPEP